MGRKVYRIICNDGTNYIAGEPSDYEPDVSVEVEEINVTIDELVEAVASETENWNYHSQIGLSAWLAKHLTRLVGPEQAKHIMWELIQDKGLLWTF